MKTETPNLIRGNTVSQPWKSPSLHLPRAAITALTTRETSSRNTRPSTRPNDSRRVRSRVQRPFSFTGAGTRQMRSRSLCNSAKTVVAPMSSVTRLTTAARISCAGSLALFSSPCTAMAPSHPMMLWIRAKNQTGHGDNNDEQRGHRKQRVVGQRGAHARGIVVDPRRYRFIDQVPDLFEIHVGHLIL